MCFGFLNITAPGHTALTPCGLSIKQDRMSLTNNKKYLCFSSDTNKVTYQRRSGRRRIR